jgi:hypothetical protein
MAKNNTGFINEAAYNKALEKAQAKANESGKIQQLVNGDYVRPKKEVEKKEAAPASTSAIAAPTIAAPTIAAPRMKKPLIRRLTLT